MWPPAECDDGIMLLFCPTSQIGFVKSEARKTQCRQRAGYCAWGCFRVFCCPALKLPNRTCVVSLEPGEALASAIHLQRGDEGFLRDVDLAELPHLLLAFLLLLQKFALTRNVAVALCGDVLAQRAHRFARDHLAADRCLDRDLEHM